jgi:DNA-binding NarL/FixJ family response regulator
MKPLPSPGHVHTFDWQWSDWAAGNRQDVITEQRELARQFLHVTYAPRRRDWVGGNPPTPDPVKCRVRLLHADGWKQNAIAQQLGISQSNVSRIVRGAS